MSKKVNSTSKPIKNGDKTPANNQGTKPSEKRGRVTGDNSSGEKFKKGKTE
jgi:hypothetical protein